MNQFTNHQTNGDDCRESGSGETSRRAFEDWAINQCRFDLRYSDPVRKTYASMKTRQAWIVWQASRAAIEITPPKFIDSREALSKGFMVDYSNGYGDAMDAYEERLKEAGITVKE